MSTTPPDTEKALQFLAGENMTDISKIKNAITRKSKMKCFMVFTELKALNKVPNWTETKKIADQHQMSITRVNVLLKALIKAGWKPSE
jgi:hypothetical protein